MPAVCNVGSVDSGHDGFSSGSVVTGEGLFTVNGIPISGDNDLSVIHVKPDTPPHVGLVLGSTRFEVNGKKIAVIGDALACGAVIASGQELFTID